MGAGTFCSAWLICSFHNLSFIYYSYPTSRRWGTANMLYALRQQRSMVECVAFYEIINLKNHKNYPGRLIGIVKNQ